MAISRNALDLGQKSDDLTWNDPISYPISSYQPNKMIVMLSITRWHVLVHLSDSNDNLNNTFSIDLDAEDTCNKFVFMH